MDYTAEQQQQYQQQQLQYQAADQSQQLQSYDASQYQAYYASYDPSQQQQPQYQYYPSHDYATATAAAVYHPDSASIYPPGVVPLQPDPNYYYIEQQPSCYAHFPPSYDSAQTVVAPPPPPAAIGQSAHKTGGKKGGKSFRGGRGHGRGRGQAGGRHGLAHGAVPASVPSLASHPGQMSLTGQVPTAPARPPRMAWCELCRVDCNTAEILEQHKNGKRHKKNLRTQVELQKLKVTTEQQNVQMLYSEVQPATMPEKVQTSGEQQMALQNLPSQIPNENAGYQTELPKITADKPEGSTADAEEEPQRKGRDQFATRGHGSKRKMRGGRGGKFMRTSEGSRKPAEPPKPKEVIPYICELCNVKCESQVVFNSHVTGKKHTANVKRFQGHRATYGDAALQSLYPTNLNAASSSAHPPLQVQQGVNDPQVLLAQLLTYVLAQAQTPGGLLAAQVQGLAAAVAQIPGSSHELQYHINPQALGLPVVSEAGDPSQYIPSQPEVPPTAGVGNLSSTPAKNTSLTPVGEAALEKPENEATKSVNSTKNEANTPSQTVESVHGKASVDAETKNKNQNPESESEEDPDEDQDEDEH